MKLLSNREVSDLFYNQWHPKYVRPLSDTIEESLCVNRIIFNVYNENWTKEEVDELFKYYQIDLTFKENLEDILK